MSNSCNSNCSSSNLSVCVCLPESSADLPGGDGGSGGSVLWKGGTVMSRDSGGSGSGRTGSSRQVIETRLVLAVAAAAVVRPPLCINGRLMVFALFLFLFSSSPSKTRQQTKTKIGGRTTLTWKKSRPNFSEIR